MTTNAELEKKLDKIIAGVSNIESAFPEGDFEGHRRYHQSLIDINEEKKKFYREMRKKTLFALFWVLVIWIGTASYHEAERVVERIILLILNRGG